MQVLSVYLQYLVSGLTMGSTYGLTALGFTIIFNATSIINFAQGEFVMLGGMFSVYYAAALGLPLILAVPLAVLSTTLVGALMERCALRPIKGASIIQFIIVTIGLAIIIRGLAMLFLGKDTYALPAFTGDLPIQFLGAAILPQNLWVIGVTLALLFGLKAFYSGTIFGRAMLACSFNRKAASYVGINVKRMVLYSVMLSAFVGSVAGAVLAPITMTSYDVGIMLGVKGFAACVLGGMGNPFGAAAGGLILGIIESFGSGLVSSAYKDAFSFIILLVFLFLKPSGLFGRAGSERV